MALKCIESSEYDINLVIMDINLPEVGNGLLLARELRGEQMLR